MGVDCSIIVRPENKVYMLDRVYPFSGMIEDVELNSKSFNERLCILSRYVAYKRPDAVHTQYWIAMARKISFEHPDSKLELVSEYTLDVYMDDMFGEDWEYDELEKEGKVVWL